MMLPQESECQSGLPNKAPRWIVKENGLGFQYKWTRYLIAHSLSEISIKIHVQITIIRDTEAYFVPITTGKVGWGSKICIYYYSFIVMKMMKSALCLRFQHSSHNNYDDDEGSKRKKTSRDRTTEEGTWYKL